MITIPLWLSLWTLMTITGHSESAQDGGICVKQCEQGAVTLDGNLAYVDPEKCVACGKCTEKCPTKAIHFL